MKDSIIAVLTIVFCCIAACSEQKEEREPKTERYIQLTHVDSLSRYNNIDSAKIIFGTIDTSKYTEAEISLFNLLSFRLYGTTKYQSSLDTMLNFSEYCFKKTHDTIHLAETYLFKAEVCFLYKDDYDRSEYYAEKCRKLASNGKPDHYLLSQVYWLRIHLNMLSADILQSIDDVQQEALHAEKSLNNRQIAYGALNTVIVLKQAGETDQLRLHLQAALNWAEYLRPDDVAYLYNVYGELALDTKPEIAKEHFRKALDLCPSFSLTKKNLALLYLNQGDYIKAEALCAECTDTYWPEDKIELLKVIAGCKIAANNLPEAIEIQKNLTAQKDSIIKRIQGRMHKTIYPDDEETNTSNNQPNEQTPIPLNIWTIVLIATTILFATLYLLSRKKIKQLQKQIEYENHNNSFGEQLYSDFIEGKKISQWDKKSQSVFLDQFRANNPGKLEDLESKYQNLTPREKIMLLLKKQGATQKEITERFKLSDAAYYTAISRINKAKK